MSAHCCFCDDEPASQRGRALPIAENLNVVHVNDPQPGWVGSPACDGCVDVYEAICKAVPDYKTVNVDKIMEAHVVATKLLRMRLEKARKFIAELRVNSGGTLDEIGD